MSSYHTAWQDRASRIFGHTLSVLLTLQSEGLSKHITACTAGQVW